MRTIRYLMLLPALLPALLLTACAPNLSQMPELPQPPQRLVMYGYSFMPPAEPGWRVAGRDGNRLVLGKVGATPDETVIIMSGHALAQAFRSSKEFEQFIRDRMISDSGPAERFSVTRNELTMLRRQGSDCARVHMTSIDRQAKKRSGKPGDMVLEIAELFCRHPGNDGIVTYLGYSQRYYSGNRDPDFDAKAGSLLDSLELTPF